MNEILLADEATVLDDLISQYAYHLILQRIETSLELEMALCVLLDDINKYAGLYQVEKDQIRDKVKQSTWQWEILLCAGVES